MHLLKGLTVSTRARALTLLAAALLMCAAVAVASPAFAATFDPLNVIPYDTWRASSSMSVSDIQSFLEAQTGPLKTLDAAKDHNGVRMPASKIIWDAAQAWNLNPKVILSTLQKEQSLLTTSNSSNSARYLKAMGCGVYDRDGDGVVDNIYPGLGNQIWNGARVLSQYELPKAPGTAGQIVGGWTPDTTKTVTAYHSYESTKVVDGKVVWYHKSYKKTIRPKNASTFALYTYTPYYPQKLVWDVYTRYFEDPQSDPRLRPVYRFKNKSTGAYYYTSSEGTRFSMISKSARTWAYGGVSFTIDASSTANITPLYRLQNTHTGRYYYTTYASTKDRRLAIRPVTWRLSGTVGLVSRVATGGALPIYKLESRATHGILFTRNKSTVTSLTTGHAPTFYNRGTAFYLGVSEETTTPVGP